MGSLRSKFGVAEGPGQHECRHERKLTTPLDSFEHRVATMRCVKDSSSRGTFKIVIAACRLCLLFTLLPETCG